MAKCPWYVTQAAVEHWMRLLRRPDTDEAFARAEDELLELATTARFKQADSQGRELWRTGRPHRVRMVVDTRKLMRQDGADLPRLIWVGSGHPPAWCWTP